MLPIVVGLMLLPLAVAPQPPPLFAHEDKIYVYGDVPPEVAALPGLVRNEGPKRIRIHAPAPPAEPAWLVEGSSLPAVLTDALDRMDKQVRVVTLEAHTLTLPNRSLLLGLVSASTLTGALAQSIPGERASRTLETLRTASVTAAEIVFGKWLAWTAFAGGMATLAGVVAVLLGHQDAGPWLLALPWVAAGTAAGGLWLVRRANDVVSGATVALRTQPAAMAAVAMAAWGLGRVHPLLGACVPLGGALMAAGSMWEGWAPVLVAILSTAAACAALLTATARDLAENDQNHLHRGVGMALAMTAGAACVWWVAILSPMVWALGGATERAAFLPTVSGQIGGTLALTCIVVALAARHPQPVESVGLVRAPRFAWGAAAAVGLTLPLLASASELWPLPSSAIWIEARTRLIGAATPQVASPLVFLCLIAAQELLFRGWIRRAGGGVLAGLAAWLVLAPLDPVRGALEAMLMGALVVASGGAVLPAILARSIGALASQVMPVAPAWLALSLAVVGAVWLVRVGRSRHR